MKGNNKGVTYAIDDFTRDAFTRASKDDEEAKMTFNVSLIRKHECVF